MAPLQEFAKKMEKAGPDQAKSFSPASKQREHWDHCAAIKRKQRNVQTQPNGMREYLPSLFCVPQGKKNIPGSPTSSLMFFLSFLNETSLPKHGPLYYHRENIEESFPKQAISDSPPNMEYPLVFVFFFANPPAIRVGHWPRFVVRPIKGQLSRVQDED